MAKRESAGHISLPAFNYCFFKGPQQVKVFVFKTGIEHGTNTRQQSALNATTPTSQQLKSEKPNLNDMTIGNISAKNQTPTELQYRQPPLPNTAAARKFSATAPVTKPLVSTVAYSLFKHRMEVQRTKLYLERIVKTKIKLTDKLIAQTKQNAATCKFEELQTMARETLFMQKMERLLCNYRIQVQARKAAKRKAKSMTEEARVILAAKRLCPKVTAPNQNLQNVAIAAKQNSMSAVKSKKSKKKKTRVILPAKRAKTESGTQMQTTIEAGKDCRIPPTQQPTTAYALFMHREELQRSKLYYERIVTSKLQLTDLLIAQNKKNAAEHTFPERQVLQREKLYKKNLKRQLENYLEAKRKLKQQERSTLVAKRSCPHAATEMAQGNVAAQNCASALKKEASSVSSAVDMCPQLAATEKEKIDAWLAAIQKRTSDTRTEQQERSVVKRLKFD